MAIDIETGDRSEIESPISYINGATGLILNKTKANSLFKTKRAHGCLLIFKLAAPLVGYHGRMSSFSKLDHRRENGLTY